MGASEQLDVTQGQRPVAQGDRWRVRQRTGREDRTEPWDPYEGPGPDRARVDRHEVVGVDRGAAGAGALGRGPVDRRRAR